MVDGLIYIVLYYSYLDTGAGAQATTKLLGRGTKVDVYVVQKTIRNIQVFEYYYIIIVFIITATI